MHKFLRAVGFSKLKQEDIRILIESIAAHPDTVRVTKDSQGNEFAELIKNFSYNSGILLRGTYDEKEHFQMEYMVPFIQGTEISTEEEVGIERHAEKESFAGVSDEMRLGITLIFYLLNAADFLAEHHANIHVRNLRGAVLSALSVDGRIVLPMKDSKKATMKVRQQQQDRVKLLEEANEGNEEAMDSLTIQDMDTYSQLSNRIKKEDILSIVTTSFMPYGIESDQYSIIADILEVDEEVNTLTKEKMYSMKLQCNDLVFQLMINQADLLGEPAVGRRFRGSIWLQGSLCI